MTTDRNVPPEPPEGLQDGGLSVWTATVTAFDLAAHELILLREACRTVDLLDGLQVLIARDGPVLPWGVGTRANPAAVEARQHRIALARLIASLGIPGDDVQDRVPVRGGARGVYAMRAVDPYRSSGAA